MAPRVPHEAARAREEAPSDSPTRPVGWYARWRYRTKGDGLALLGWQDDVMIDTAFDFRPDALTDDRDQSSPTLRR